MTFYLKVFIKVFLSATLGAGLFWWWRLSYAVGPMEAIYYGVLFGSAIGLVVAFFVVLLDYLRRKTVFKKYGHESFDLMQSREIYLDGSMDNAIDRCNEALKNIKGVINIKTNNDKNEIMALRKKSWTTAGEKLSIKLQGQAGKVLVSVISQPRRKSAIVDGGRNIENVEEILHGLRGPKKDK